MEDIPLRLKQLREFLGYTKLQFSKFVEMSDSNYGKIERGLLSINLQIITAYMEMCREKNLTLNLYWLLWGEGEMFLSNSEFESKISTNEFRILKRYRDSEPFRFLVDHYMLFEDSILEMIKKTIDHPFNRKE
jgi:transcriptional regulator with XRE-family HTH domain